ncbi:MAG: RNA polymerase sigma factor [bacterium]|nr:RNA polymerase sigma factor [bacterium]
MDSPAHKPSSKAADDVLLVRAALDGDGSAARSLEERLLGVPRFLALINRRHGTALRDHDLEDLAQDTLIRIWKKLDTFEGRGTLETWMFRFSLLEYLNRLRRKGRDPVLPPADPPGREPDAAPGGVEHDDLLRCLEEIPPAESEVIELRHFEGLSFQDIGERIGVPTNTARTRYYRGLKRLKGKLTRAEAEEAS